MHIINHHYGYKAMINNLIVKSFYWEDFTSDIRRIINNCEISKANIKKNIKLLLKIITDEGIILDIY